MALRAERCRTCTGLLCRSPDSLAMPLGKFIAVTVTPGRAAPLASRIDPVSVVAATPGFKVVDGSTLNVGAAATAGGFAGAAGDCAVKPVACGSLRWDPACRTRGARRQARLGSNVTTFGSRRPLRGRRRLPFRPHLHDRDDDDRCGSRAKAHTPSRPEQRRTWANQRARPASAASRTAARCAAVSRSG